MFNSLSRRGIVSAMVTTFVLAASSSAASAQSFPAVQRVVAVQPVGTLLQGFNPVIRAMTTPPVRLTLGQLVDQFADGTMLDEQHNCLATAVYFESKGEPLQGQLAVARVVINRAASGRYPTSWCAVVKQKAQFSFVRRGRFPRIDPACAAWRKAQSIARIAAANASATLATDVLWYHADYVAPSWGRRLNRVEKIGAHIFYRS